MKPTGTVQLFEGTTSIASGTFVKGAAVVNAAFSHGVHDVRAVYSGDAYYRAATWNLKIEGLSGGLFPLEAHGTANGIRIVYAMPLYALPETLQLFRRPAGTAAWAAVPGWNRSTGIDASALSRGVVYEYRLYVVFENGSRSFSNIDSAMLKQSRRRAASR